MKLIAFKRYSWLGFQRSNDVVLTMITKDDEAVYTANEKDSSELSLLSL